jgi:transposase
MKHTIIGVDLAKHVIQICIVKNNKMISNKEIQARDFTHWLAKASKAIIVFEACATSNYWKQVALKMGHDARLISARLVSKIRQHQKTDKNDALAIVQASQLVNIKFIKGKTFDQQELQSLMRMRELAVRQKVAIAKQIDSLLLEFNIKISPRTGGIKGTVLSVLEDAENGFSMTFREGLQIAWQFYLQALQSILDYEHLLEKMLKIHPQCIKLMALEGVSTINAINLYIALGCDDIGTFKTGREAAACIGVTPIQYSSGGKIKLGSIGKYTRNTQLRSYLIVGAMAVVKVVAKREPKTKKEQWLKQLIERRGMKCAAVALANKTVRTAFALLTQGTEYSAQPLEG